MVWEHIKIREDNGFTSGDSGDMDVPLPRNRAIASLALTVRNKNGATSNCIDNEALQTVIESMEMIKIEAGSRVFKEYSGQVCRDWATYRNGRMPFYTHTQVAGATYPTGWSEALFPINFGRYPGDKSVFLAAPLYDSLDLKMTYDFTISSTGGFVTGKHKFDLYADILPPMSHEALTGSRVIEQRKKQDHTTIASGIEPIALTLDGRRQMRQILIRCYEHNIAEGVDVTDISLDVDSQEIVTDDWKRWQWQNALDCKLKYEQIAHMQSSGNSTANSDIIWSLIPNVEPFVSAVDTGAENLYLTAAGDEITVANGTNDEKYDLILKSQVVPTCVFIDFDKNLSMADVLAQGVRDIELKLTQGGAGGAVEIHEMSLAPAQA